MKTILIFTTQLSRKEFLLTDKVDGKIIGKSILTLVKEDFTN
jgi:hypothetical protein